MNNIFPNLPAKSKVWIYLSEQKLTSTQAEICQTELTKLVAEWHSHKDKVNGEATLLFNSIIIIAADESNFGISGCSIDSTVKVVKEIVSKTGVDFFNRMVIGKKNETDLDLISFYEYKMNPADLLLNTLPENISDFRENMFVSVDKHWVKKVK